MTNAKIISGRPAISSSVVAGVNRLGGIVSRPYGSGTPNYGTLPQIANDYLRSDTGKVINVSSGTTVLISGVTNRSIEVDNYTFVASGASTINFLSGSTSISGPMSIGANGGASANTDDGFLFRTVAGEALSIVTTSNVAGHLSYRLV